MIAPTLLDWARIWAVLRVSVPRGCDSPMTRSATWIWGGRLNSLSGLTTFSSSAPATVTDYRVTRTAMPAKWAWPP